ncbi:MAG TPA: Asp-tRNA(Asn)/Glu-tRNA(Gln) amidotransferase subunit GatB [Longimicrobiaceae bacterium]|nr:Asp-tRNA(Asn)/Glu-tRNA(Gln) amidotransferase subunit GatB [Longimicrobiaceae bacterium]
MAETRLEPAIGLEVHVQLRTRTKLFCGDLAEYGAPPNTRVCPVCLGLPGALPALNERAVELAVRVALGLSSTVQERSAFARKHYFYPDLPGGYQVTQHAEPLATGGYLLLPDADGGKPLAVRIRSVHLEEDSGKSLHGRVPGATALDLNRAGVPLVEIVTEPDLRSPEQARAFLQRLRQTLQYVGASDCDMERGSLRVDANVSLRPAGSAALGTRTEVKNLNSFSGVERALRFEIERQGALLAVGGRVEPATLLWDAARGEARVLRAKEEGADYRYIPEPDLPPLVVTGEWLKRIRRDLPELPAERAARFVRDHGLDPKHAEAVTATRELADYYEAVARRTDPREAAVWVLGDFLAAVNTAGCDLDRFPVRPADLAELIELLAAGILTRPAAKRVLARMAETGKPPAQVVGEEGLHRTGDATELEGWADEAVRGHPEEAARWRAGETRLLDFFVGEVVRLSGGRADPHEARAAVTARLEAR